MPARSAPLASCASNRPSPCISMSLSCCGWPTRKTRTTGIRSQACLRGSTSTPLKQEPGFSMLTATAIGLLILAGQPVSSFNGLLHFITAIDGAVAALDMDGQTRSVIPVPRRGGGGFIGHSQGRLLYASRDVGNTSKLPIYVLLGEEGESNGSRWTLKHCVDTSGLVFTDADEYLLQSGLLVGLGVIHPHGDSIFLFDSLQGKLMSYSMDSERAHVIRSVTKSPYFWSFLPYVPHYLETAALQNSN